LNNSNADEIPIWCALHESIQWILYMPVVFGLSFVFSFLFKLFSNFRGDFECIFLYLQSPLNAGLMATLSFWLGLNLAPRMPRFCAWVLYSIWSVFILLTIFRFVAIAFFRDDMSIQQSNVIELLQSIGWLAAGIFFLLRWGKEFALA
jgi:hypothetical protein